MGLFNPLLVSAISCYDIAHAHIGLPQNFYHGKPEHVAKKLMGEERGLWGLGLHGLLKLRHSTVLRNCE